MKVVLIMLVVLILLGFALIVFSWVFDPFTIPFPDYDQMPEETKVQYEQESQSMNQIGTLGFGISITAFLALVVVLIIKRFKS